MSHPGHIILNSRDDRMEVQIRVKLKREVSDEEAELIEAAAERALETIVGPQE